MDRDTGDTVKVCFIMLQSYPLFNPEVKKIFGGAEVDCYYLATELAKDKDYNVSCIVADYGQPPVEVRQGVALIRSLDFDKNLLVGAWRLWQEFKEADADIYMLKTASAGVPLVAFFCKIYSRCFVYRTAHQYEYDGTYLKKHFFLGKSFAWALRQAKVVFAQNNNDEEQLQKTIGIGSIAIPNGHRLSGLAGDERDSILWVGRTADFKKPRRFIELARKFPDEKFVMICQQATGDKHYNELVRDAESVSNLEFHKHVEFGRVDSFFNRAKVFVNTSDAEGFPNTFIQACKCQTPILSLNVNPDGFLVKYKCGMCACGDWERFAGMLKQLLDEETGRQYGGNGRQYAEEHHDIARIVEQYKSIFVKLAEENK